MIKLHPPTHPIRLDIYLRKTLEISRNRVQELIKKHQIKINNKSSKSSYMFLPTDTISIQFPEKNPTILPENIPLDLLYEDNDLLILNKPSGLVVHPGKTTGTLVNALKFYTPILSDIGSSFRPGIVHRLDKDTEGLMIIAKTNHAHTSLTQQFRDRMIEKKYYAMIQGDPKETSFQINLPIKRHSKHRLKMKITTTSDPLAKEALTKIKILKRYNSASLIEIRTLTGRTHQIRVHLAHVGHPILGDPVYKKKSPKISGQLLQAFFLSFVHPTIKLRISFQLPLSKRIKNK